ncbi:spore germination protein GerPC [Paenibacillus hexagrammi]|uniref:Spore germination protein GerPC n=1 Tax=Paenibacillus hexagrammi TaxID=2908839 RepID=A0ABY3SIT7_9BACL|nr:spore germination protein GerPC [Paenibacillus sp. YPD9-1]UJF32892.1 spore germination protein GerPC [Paenibacillus sp. YPD9-1]
MHTPMTWQQWTQQLCAYVEAQKQRIDALEQTLQKLQTEVEQMKTAKDQKQIHIDRIEYKFDQLKVERLEGTLTIGVHPGVTDHVDDFTVNGKPVGEGQEISAAPPSPPGVSGKDNGAMQQQVTSGIDQYLEQDVFDDMRQLEEKYRYHLDDGYREMILDDIRRQLDHRIGHYVHQFRSAGFQEPIEAVQTSILDKTKKDILSAIEAYISNLPRKEE